MQASRHIWPGIASQDKTGNRVNKGLKQDSPYASVANVTPCFTSPFNFVINYRFATCGRGICSWSAYTAIQPCSISNRGSLLCICQSPAINDILRLGISIFYFSRSVPWVAYKSATTDAVRANEYIRKSEMLPCSKRSPSQLDLPR